MVRRENHRENQRAKMEREKVSSMIRKAKDMERTTTEARAKENPKHVLCVDVQGILPKTAGKQLRFDKWAQM